MKSIASVEAYYPLFPLGGKAAATLCTLSLLEAEDGKRYVKTPLSLLEARGDDAHLRQLGYFTTEAACQGYLAAEYPWAEEAQPVMHALMRARRVSGDLAGSRSVANQVGASHLDGSIFRLARGHKSYTQGQVIAAAEALQS